LQLRGRLGLRRWLRLRFLRALRQGEPA
jgi:hypothetical protein